MTALPPDELRRCIELLERIVDDPLLLANVPNEDRVALLTAAGRLSRPLRHERARFGKALRRVDRKNGQEADRAIRAETHIRTAREATVFSAPPQLTEGGDVLPAPELRQARACYVCKAPYRKVHFFYDSMCPDCAALNYEKRFQSASLAGRTAVITGARIKIGFQSALMMLRAGARVIVTTRFPRDAAARFSRENDFDRFRDRLSVYGLDLRHAPSVELFARHLERTEERLDILINNAAQTVRRPPAFYAHMIELETRDWDDLPSEMKSVLAAHEVCKKALALSPRSAEEARAMSRAATGLTCFRTDEPGVGVRASAALSQVPYMQEDMDAAAAFFPAGKADADLQQIDLRTMNSWRMTLAEVPSAEMLEVQLVNSVAPFILASKLKALMLRHPTGQKHVVNVSAMEGQFARGTKTDKHPHTNMAKAALNMMTLTSAPDYAKCGIFMNAVDTGWVTDEDPIAHAMRKRKDHDFQPPLDIVDGAARVCDPFFSGLLTGVHVWGKFLKDYAACAW